MLVKEKNAKMVACPLLGSHAINIGCKGSHCMAWRWATPRRSGQDPDNPSDDWGYCGMAGRPVGVIDPQEGEHALPPAQQVPPKR
jgi:hypothetical protein